MKLPTLRRFASWLVPCLAVAGLTLTQLTDETTPTDAETASADPYAKVAHVISEKDFKRLPKRLQKILVNLADAGSPPIASCFTGIMPDEFTAAFNALIENGTEDFQLGQRWTNTAYSGGGLGQGDPTVLSYSFVDDGVNIPNAGFGSGPSDLQATLNGIFGSTAAWQQRFHDVFDRWEEVSGLTFIFEPNDDGAPLHNSSGQPGVRGDLRIAGKSLDGQSGSNVLAYNYFPNNGDMVIDTDNVNFWSSSSNNYLALRNVISHEHGHGMGLAHVCPANQTKLMEPFISTAYDGPQLDDIQAANRFYGDRFEDNNNQGQAADLGTFGPGNYQIDDVSIDDNSDNDWYAFTVPGFNTASVTVTPVGATYLNGPQNGDGSCSSGTNYNALNVHNLGIELRDQNGTTIIASSNSAGAGSAETIPSEDLVNGPGTYYVRVFGDSTNNIQLYRLNFSIGTFTPPGFAIEFPNGTPSEVSPETVTLVDVSTAIFGSSPDPSSGQLFVSIDGGAFQSSPLAHLGGNDYQAALPAAPCAAEVEWYVTLDTQGGGPTVFGPLTAPGLSNSADAIAGLSTVFSDNFQTNQGWTVSGNAGDGQWDRGTPVGGGDRGDPPVDSDGSGACYLTDNVDGNSDVDGGQTILTSPSINLSGFPSAFVTFDFWHDNDFGASPNEDPFLIEINTGSGWSLFESYNANNDQWNSRTLEITGAPSSFQIRFTSQDIGDGSVVESGVDNVVVLGCADAPQLDPSCAGGNVGGSGENIFLVGGSDGGAARRVQANTLQAIELAMLQPSGAGGPVPAALFFQVGAVGPADLLTVPGIGTFCIGSGLTTLGPLVAGVSAPFNILTAGLDTQLEFTMQGVVADGGGISVTNAVTLIVQ